MKQKCVEIAIPGREFLEICYELQDNQLVNLKVNAIGGLDFLQISQSFAKKLSGPVDELEAPGPDDRMSPNQSVAQRIWREAILKIKGEWSPPYQDETICFCRSVATDLVHMAILKGASNAAQVTAICSTSTGCGTCQPDVESLIKYRTGS